jgi:MFS transporter, SP family, general alpha glucoside:H+ symporter
VGELAGLVINSFAQDRFGCRPTYIFFMIWLALAIFIAVFAPSISVLAFGEAMSGISWGVFQVKFEFGPCGGAHADWARSSQPPMLVR